MSIVRMVGVPWFRREDYARIRELCDDELFATFDEWEKVAQRRYDQHLAAGAPLEKVMIDPDDLAAFARDAAATKIDGAIRAEFAARVVAKKYGNRSH